MIILLILNRLSRNIQELNQLLMKLYKIILSKLKGDKNKNLDQHKESLAAVLPLTLAPSQTLT